MIGETTIEIGSVDLCVASEVLYGNTTDSFSIEDKLYDPVLGSFAPSSMPSDVPTDTPTASPTDSPTTTPTTAPSTVPSYSPSLKASDVPSGNPTSSPTAAPFFENYDGPGDKEDGQDSNCAATVDTGAVYSIDDSSGESVATYQYDVMIGETTIEIGSVDLCVASEVLYGNTTDSFSIEDKLYDPVLGSFAPSSMPSDVPTDTPTASPTDSPTTTPTTAPSTVPSYSPSLKASDVPSGNPTSSPTAAPSDNPSLTPTGLPTVVPSQTPTDDKSFTIGFTNVTTDFDTSKTISVHFELTRNSLDDVDISLLDGTCNVAAEVDEKYLQKTNIDYNDANNKTGVVVLGIDPEAVIADSSLFDGSIITFCVRADMTGRSMGYNESISFTETVVALSFDLEAGFEIVDVSLEGIEATKVNKTESFLVDTCMCTMDGNNATCVAKKLKQNSEFDLCIFSLAGAVEIDEVTSMEMEQNGNVKFSPIVNSKANPFTQVVTKQVYSKQDSTGAWKEHNAARVSSRVVSAFFIDKALDPVIMKGNVLLAFADQTSKGNRKLLEEIKDTKESQFATKVLLDDGSAMMKAETTESTAKSNMLNLVAIIAACVVIIAFAIAVYLKKKN